MNSCSSSSPKLKSSSLFFCMFIISSNAYINEPPYRTAFSSNFQSMKVFNCDPNAPMLYKRVYHLFYLHIPNEGVWGSPVWGHLTSTNMANWTRQPIILQHKSPINRNGSRFRLATILPYSKSAILFKGTIKPQEKQVQNSYPIYVEGKPIGAEISMITNKVKHVLKVSLDDPKNNVYTIGKYDNVVKDAYLPDEGYIKDFDYSLSSAYRTAYHFQPAQGFMNDPNAPMLYNGVYHLFYQHNPNEVVWGSPVWGHSTSTDMVNWTPQPIILRHESPVNRYGSWSGSATILPGNKPTIMFTGTINPHKEQVQNLALPKNLSDPYLKEWYLVSNNPIMTLTPKNQMIENSFRDPTTAWILPDGYWRTLVGHKRGNTGVALLFKTEDFNIWIQVDKPIYSYPNSGMWECPDFFPVFAGVETSVISNNVKHVLKVSLDDPNHDVYTIGKYDVVKDAFIPDQGYMNDSSLRYDYGKYYGSKTFFDYSTNRRILFGWANESSSVVDDKKKGWAGIYSIPREIWLDKLGKQLIQWPIREIEKLRGKPVRPLIKELEAGSIIEVSGITANQADVSISFKIKDLKNAEKFEASWTDPQLLCSQMGASIKGGLGPFGLLIMATIDLEEYTAVFFRIFQGDAKLMVLMCSDQSRSSLNPTNDKTTYGTFVDVDPVTEGLSLRSLIDNSVIESFGAKGKSVITARVYPTQAIYDQAHLFVFNCGMSSVETSELTGWSMMKAEIA